MIQFRLEWCYATRDYIRNYLHFAYMLLDQILGFWILKYRFYLSVGYWPNFSEPKTFNEKINWRKIYDKAPIYKITSDKLRLREYLTSRFGSQAANNILPKVLLITTRPTPDLLKSFGTGVAIKANHGTGWVEIVPKDSNPNWDIIAFKARSWLRKTYGKNKHEWGYYGIEAKVYIEELILNEDGDPAMDIKFHVMDGICEWLEVVYNRQKGAKFARANRDWEKLDITWKKYTQGELPRKPEYFQEIRSLAEKIGNDFDYIRVDILSGARDWKLNELTLHDGSGFVAYDDPQVDLNQGARWRHRRNNLTI